LKCDSFNNSFFSAVLPDYELRYTEGTSFDAVTMTDFDNATVVAAGESLGSGTWYSYAGGPGNPALVPNFVFYMVVDGNKFVMKINAIFFIPSTVPLTPEGGTMTSIRTFGTL